MTDASDRAGSIRETVRVNDGEMAVLHWPAPSRPRLVFAHANGFCASAARRMLAGLADKFDIIAPDLRGHGRTRLPADPATLTCWSVHADDLLALCAALDRPPDYLAGHSMGASSMLLAASRMADAPPLALIEPVVLPGLAARAARTPLWALFKRSMAISKTARKRTNAWPDRAAVRARYGDKANFARWAPGVLDDYLADGLEETGDAVRLACDPAWEAANYEAQAHDLMDAMRRVRAAVRICKAEHGSTVLNQAGLVRRGAQVEMMDGAGHLAVMEQPERIAAWISTGFRETE